MSSSGGRSGEGEAVSSRPGGAGSAVLSGWYKDFFKGAPMDFWRLAVPLDWTADEVRFLEKWAGAPKGGAILDVLCGFGRHALELARLGYRVTGVDISPEAIDRLARDAKAEGLEVRAILGDVLELPPFGPHDAACCLGNSFGYFDDAGMRAFVAKVAASLGPGGRFILNTAMAAESILPEFPERDWTPAGDITLLVENAYLARESTVVTRYVFVREGRTESSTSRHLVMTTAAIVRMLEEAGLRTLEMFGSTEGDPFRLRSPQLYLVAEKA
jgi:SAM-dependent methyltransferase